MTHRELNEGYGGFKSALKSFLVGHGMPSPDNEFTNEFIEFFKPDLSKFNDGHTWSRGDEEPDYGLIGGGVSFIESKEDKCPECGKDIEDCTCWEDDEKGEVCFRCGAPIAFEKGPDGEYYCDHCLGDYFGYGVRKRHGR